MNLGSDDEDLPARQGLDEAGDDDDDDRIDLIPSTEVEESLKSRIVKPEVFARLPPFLLDFRELGKEATWTLSSAKSGNGAEALRNGDTQTYWQSDGKHPHTITVQFHRRVAVVAIAMYCTYRLDESYTPKRVRVVAGTSLRDLEHVVEVDLENPEGWVLIDVCEPATKKPLKIFTLQIRCIAMHQNGRDTHVRAVKIYGSRSTDAVAPSQQSQVEKPLVAANALPSLDFSSTLSGFSMIR